jgi:hypothetical protein
MGTYVAGGTLSCVIDGSLATNVVMNGTASPTSYYGFYVDNLNAPVEITLESEDNTLAMVSASFDTCPTFLAQPLVSNQEVGTSFYKHARIQLSTASQPRLKGGQWYIGIQVASNITKTFKITADYGTPYNNYWLPIVLLFAVYPVVLGYVAAVMWMLLRQGILPGKYNIISVT